MTYKYDTREVTHGNTTGFFAKISKTESGTLDLKTVSIYRIAKNIF